MALCELGKNFAIEFDMSFFQSRDEFTVRDAVVLRGCADFNLPQGAEAPFFLFAARERVGPSVQQRFARHALF